MESQQKVGKLDKNRKIPKKYVYIKIFKKLKKKIAEDQKTFSIHCKIKKFLINWKIGKIQSEDLNIFKNHLNSFEIVEFLDRNKSIYLQKFEKF